MERENFCRHAVSRISGKCAPASAALDGLEYEANRQPDSASRRHWLKRMYLERNRDEDHFDSHNYHDRRCSFES